MKKIKKIKYLTIDLRTLDGFELAEKLQQKGYKIGSVGFHTIQMWKECSSKR